MQLADWNGQVRELVARVAPRVVAVHSGRQRASGWLFDESHVVTVEHALDGSGQVYFGDGSERTSQLVGSSAGLDLAVLRLDSPVEAPAFSALSASELEPGDWVLALARSADEGIGVAQGVVACRSGSWQSCRGGQGEHFLQPDLRLYPGYSGGPLVDAQGNWLGINTVGLSRFQPVTLDVSTVSREVAQIIQGRPEPGYLGVGLHTVDWDGDAAMVVRLVAESPAAQAGVLLGDILLELDGQRAGGTAEVFRRLQTLEAGQRVNSRWIRAGQEREAVLQLGHRPLRGAADE